MSIDNQNTNTRPSFWGLTPLIVFLLTYLASSIILQDFYAMPLSVAFVIASSYAVLITRGIKLEERIQIFTKGAADINIVTMIWIFVLAGAFAEGAKALGSIDATVQLILHILPPGLLLPGIFLASCLISLSIGTSVGTIVALTPIALGFAKGTGIELSYMLGIVAGGAFFGDNLSFISDTTIAATRTQGVSMKSKFRTNIRIALPAALICLIIYTMAGLDLHVRETTSLASPWLILPYIIVIVTAIAGINVLVVLLLGILSCGVLVLSMSTLPFWDWVASLGRGITGMGELIIVTLLAGGMLALIKYNGGIDYLLGHLMRFARGRRGGELVIGLLVIIANICTANNTIAILTTGGVARDISKSYGIDPTRAASLLDTYSCMTQGLLPYGAQLLLAAGFAQISPFSIVGSLYYPMLLGLMTTLTIFINYPKKAKA